MRRLAIAAPFVALLIGALAQKLAHQGIETGLLRALGVALALALLDLGATRLGVRARAWLGQPLAALLLVASGLAAIAVYPLPRGPVSLALAWALGAFLLDVLAWRAFPDDADPARRAKLRRLFQATLLAVTLVGGTIAGEISLRATGKYASWREKNGLAYVSPYAWRPREPWLHVYPRGAPLVQKQPEFAFEDTTNSEGLRDVEHPVAKPEDEYRVVGLGDSFTMGQGAALEDTWLKVLERRLNATPRAKRFRALSGGVEGSDPVFEHELLARSLVKYQPDLVLVAINGSDVPDVVTRGGLDRFAPDGSLKPDRAPWLDGPFARSHLFRAVALGLLDYDWSLLRPGERAVREAEASAQLLLACEAIRELGKKEGFATLVVLHPFSYQLHGERRDHHELEPLARGLDEKRLPWADLFPFFRDEVPEARLAEFFWPIDRHCTKKGYDVLARGVERALDQVPGFPQRR